MRLLRHLSVLVLLSLLWTAPLCAQRPAKVWVEDDGVVFIEAEAVDTPLDPDEWVLETEPNGYTGAGYLVRTAWGNMYKDPLVFDALTDTTKLLRYRVKINEPGEYAVHIRNRHQEEDGDNDAWIWRVGRSVTDESPVVRMGDSLEEGKGFSWLDWGVRSFWLKEGINNLYIGGRSFGFGIDRIALYRDGDAEAKKRAFDPATSPSPRVDK